MKKLLPWLCLAATSSVYATEAIDAYRLGLYTEAAKTLPQLSGKDPVADYYLGRMWLYGYGALKNNTLALSYFTKAAEKGYLPAQQFLAEYYLIEAKLPDTALTWFKKAADAGNIKAQLYCASAYLYGVGTKKNSDIAKRYLIDAAKNGSAIGQYALAEQFLETRDQSNKKLGVIWLTKAANQNNPIAKRKLGQMYLTGQVVAKDLIKGTSLLEEAAAQNDLPALLTLAEYAQKEGNYTSAKNWFNKAVATKDVSANVALATFLLDEKNPEHNDKEAFTLLLSAAQAGSIDGQKMIATLYRAGKGVHQDENLAKEWDAKASKTTAARTDENEAALWLSNNQYTSLSKAGYSLGGIYTAWNNKDALKQGIYNAAPKMNTISRNEIYKPDFTLSQPGEIPISNYFSILAPLLNAEKSTQWSFPRYAIDKKIDSVMRHDSLVLRHAPGNFIIDDEANYTIPDRTIEPFNYFAQKTKDFAHQANLQAVLSELYGQAILGVPTAQFQIGQLYQYGIGVQQNIEQAQIYYQLAAIQQDVRAEYNLGILYLEGKTNPINYAQGIQWMTSAAFKGNAYAQYVLANLYEHGLKDNTGTEVVQPNHLQAIAMYYLASANHYGEAEYKLADSLVKEKAVNQSVAAIKARTELIKSLYAGAAKRGVAEAILPLAFYDAMDADPTKQTHALKVARTEAEEGNSEAALLLAIMLDRGIGTEVNHQEAIQWYQKAEANPVSRFILGTYYGEGKNLDKNVPKARELLQESADAGFSYAQLNLAILKHASGEHFIDDLNKAREAGNARAGILLADYYLTQGNNTENMAEARSIYQYFAEKGDKNAELKLGFLFDQGLGGEANPQTAASWYLQAAVQGQPIAQFLLGNLYQLGRIDNKEPNYPEAKKWYQKALQQYPNAALALGFIYDTVDDDYQNALENYSIAASNPAAQYNIGLIYEYGKGMPVDKKSAELWYKKAASLGLSEAMAQLAHLDFQANKVQEAVQEYTAAAKLNEPTALYQLGLLSETGVGLTRDPNQAVNYYQKAASLGNEKASFALARMLQYGLGVPKDMNKAIAIYQELANNHNAHAQYQLAMIYISGASGEQMINAGKELLQKASANGNILAQKNMRLQNAHTESHTSFIESANMNALTLSQNKTAERMYFDAINAWNRGDENLSRIILKQLIVQYPNYAPAKQTAQQFN